MNKKIYYLLTILIGSLLVTHMPTATAENNYPIVLVHGFMGWGPEELCTQKGCFKYWGYTFVKKDQTDHPSDIENILKNNGHDVAVASVGPITTTWERTAELYAQLTGNIVDYGEAYAARVGLASRYGKHTYYNKPIVRDFCANGNKIHLIGHSYGGQTINMLAHLLKYGDPTEKALPGHSALFDGGNNCIASVSSLSASHNGSSAAHIISEAIPPAQQLFVLASAIVELAPLEKFDFDLQQWGIEKTFGESIEAYWDKVANSQIWNSPYNCLRDLIPYETTVTYNENSITYPGVTELNNYLKLAPNVYYFSVTTEETEDDALNHTDYKVPENTMTAVLKPFGLMMGRYDETAAGQTFGSEWYESDGFVNTISQFAPFDDVDAGNLVEFVPGISTPQKGKWNAWPTQHSWDHGNIVGLNQDPEELKSFYLQLASTLANLPQ